MKYEKINGKLKHIYISKLSTFPILNKYSKKFKKKIKQTLTGF